MRLVDRLVTLDVPLTSTWQTLIDPATWPDWMPVRRMDVSPDGHIDHNTSGVIHWRSGRAMRVRVTEFRAGRSFRLTGSVFGSTVSYDFVATSAGEGSEVLFILETTGPTAPLLGRFLRRSYDRQLDEAIPAFRQVAAAR